MHRQVLEQCLEVRESVLELLQHREALVQCLELREGVQAALSSTQIIGEVVDRTSELDLSLAGVSDNTARHGRAIASLTEQQRRTSDTLDAVVRAVKRLDRSRSRQRGAARQAGSSAPSERAASTRSMPFYERQGEGVDEEERFLRARQEFAEFDVEGLPAPDDPWYWPGWDGPAHDRPPRSSRPSSARARQSKPAGVGRAAEPAFVGDEVLGNRQEAESRPVDHNDFRNGTTGQATSQMADCVKGVLSRINEALTKLDQPQDWEPVMPGIGTPGTARAQQAEVQSAEAFASARPGPGPGSRLSARGQAGAKSPVLVTPRAFLGKFQDGAPRDGHWRVVDSWA